MSQLCHNSLKFTHIRAFLMDWDEWQSFKRGNGIICLAKSNSESIQVEDCSMGDHKVSFQQCERAISKMISINSQKGISCKLALPCKDIRGFDRQISVRHCKNGKWVDLATEIHFFGYKNINLKMAVTKAPITEGKFIAISRPQKEQVKITREIDQIDITESLKVMMSIDSAFYANFYADYECKHLDLSALIFDGRHKDISRHIESVSNPIEVVFTNYRFDKETRMVVPFPNLSLEKSRIFKNNKEKKIIYFIIKNNNKFCLEDKQIIEDEKYIKNLMFRVSRPFTRMHVFCCEQNCEESELTNSAEILDSYVGLCLFVVQCYQHLHEKNNHMIFIGTKNNFFDFDSKISGNNYTKVSQREKNFVASEGTDFVLEISGNCIFSNEAKTKEISCSVHFPVEEVLLIKPKNIFAQKFSEFYGGSLNLKYNSTQKGKLITRFPILIEKETNDIIDYLAQKNANFMLTLHRDSAELIDDLSTILVNEDDILRHVTKECGNYYQHQISEINSVQRKYKLVQNIMMVWWKRQLRFINKVQKIIEFCRRERREEIAEEILKLNL